MIDLERLTDIKWICDSGSSNGRTLGFGPSNLGSNPSPEATTCLSKAGLCRGSQVGMRTVTTIAVGSGAKTVPAGACSDATVCVSATGGPSYRPSQCAEDYISYSV